jgi:hypothetical protein
VTAVHPQLRAIADEFDAASARLDRLASQVPESEWGARPSPDRWSVSECVQHLSLTAKGYEVAARQAVAEARARGGPPPARYRRDPAGWLLWKMVSPVPTFRMPTTAPFPPSDILARDIVLAEFRGWQEAQHSWVREADGLPIHRVKVASPFNPKLRYSFYAALTILPRHQHRHLCQAERVWEALQAAGPV